MKNQRPRTIRCCNAAVECSDVKWLVDPFICQLSSKTSQIFWFYAISRKAIQDWLMNWYETWLSGVSSRTMGKRLCKGRLACQYIPDSKSDSVSTSAGLGNRQLEVGSMCSQELQDLLSRASTRLNMQVSAGRSCWNLWCEWSLRGLQS